MIPEVMTSYGVLIALWDRGDVRFVLDGATAPNARTVSMIRLLRAIGPRAVVGVERGAAFVQYDDFIKSDLCSIGFGRRRDEAPGVCLIPDAFFLDSRGYADLRTAAHAGQLPAWRERKDQLFWRGSASTNGRTSTGGQVTRLADVPRVALCLKLRDRPDADAAIFAPWGFEFPANEAIEWFRAERIFRPAIKPIAHAAYRYLIDIDGVANAWSFFEKLILGACVLKVTSAYEQWFYDRIEPWTHYIPVAEDLCDLDEKMAWCRENPEAAEAIAQAGQAFALSFTYDDAEDQIEAALRRCLVPF